MSATGPPPVAAGAAAGSLPAAWGRPVGSSSPVLAATRASATQPRISPVRLRAITDHLARGGRRPGPAQVCAQRLSSEELRPFPWLIRWRARPGGLYLAVLAAGPGAPRARQLRRVTRHRAAP